MKKNIQGLFIGFFLTALSLSTLSCKKMFDLSPEDALEYDKAYQNVYDADAVIWGIYGKLLGIADRYMVLNELRADLEDVTINSDKYLKEINDHNVSDDNPWADPKPFYEIIVNCNDALVNFDKMLQEKRLSQADYNIRYSEVGAIRSWVYLQVGIHYGTVPYVTDALASINDVQDESKYPRIPFNELINKLVEFTEGLPNKDPIPTGTSLIRSLDGYISTKMFINKYALLGDLYLWKGEWMQAAHYYNKLVNYADVLYPAKDSENWYETYKVAWTGNINGENWSDIFTQPFNERYSNYEIVWNIPFDKNYAPKNPFIDLYSATGGGYKIKPSELAIKKWDDQTRLGNSLEDVYRGAGNSYRFRNNPEVYKLITNFNSQNPFETGGKWILYRAALLHLRIAEAAANVDQDRISYALLNYGITKTFDPTYNESTGTSSTANRNVTDIQQSTSDVNSPFYFDGRFGTNPHHRGSFHRSNGVRHRVGLVPATVDSTLYFNDDKSVKDRPGLTRAMEDLLIEEAALELAFEGNRWPDLLRIALRRKNIEGGDEYLGEKIAAKFRAKGDLTGAEAIRAKLKDESNWYLPFNID